MSYEEARERFDMSASEVKMEMGPDMHLRLHAEEISDNKFIELVMEAMNRIAIVRAARGK